MTNNKMVNQPPSLANFNDYTLSASTFCDENNRHYTTFPNYNEFFTISKPQAELADMLIRQIRAGSGEEV